MTRRKTSWWLGCVATLLLFSESGFLFAQPDGADVVIGKYRVIHSKILNEDRTLLIHLPRDYEGGMQSYPVVYLLYGDHVTTYFAEAVSVLDRLGPTGRIPDCILVGIMNTDRYRDLLPLAPDGKPTGIGNFIRFLEEEAFPFIEGNYRTKNYRILVGPQAGANFGLYTLFEHPDLFQACIINHPFRWQGGRDAIIQKASICLAQGKVLKKFVFITYNDADPLAREGMAQLNKFIEMARASQGKSSEFYSMPWSDIRGRPTVIFAWPICWRERESWNKPGSTCTKRWSSFPRTAACSPRGWTRLTEGSPRRPPTRSKRRSGRREPRPAFKGVAN